MRHFVHRCLAVASVIALALVCQSPASADELVRFPSAGTSNGLQGFLTKPKGAGPFPAVVLLHSCLGLPSDRNTIGSMLAGWGYVALFVDDFATRGLGDTCAVDFPEGLADAFGGLAFVAGLPYVDKSRIAAIGYSQGADTALKLAALGPALPNAIGLRAIAALYPPCGNRPSAQLRLPTLILVGGADNVTPATYCQELARNQSTANLELIVYPGAGHVFDDPAFAGGKTVLGMWLQFNQAAAVKSHAQLRAFLAAKLAP